MSQLLDQLEQLKTALIHLGEKHRFVTSEVARLSVQPAIAPEQLETLERQINQLEQHNQTLSEELTEQQAQQQQLQQQQQVLTQRYQELDAAYQLAQAQISTLTAEKQKLIDKNRVAAEHTKLVLERLSKIDSETLS